MCREFAWLNKSSQRATRQLSVKHRLNIAVKDPIPVHMIHRFDKLIHVAFYTILGKVVPAAPNELVDITLHEFKY